MIGELGRPPGYHPGHGMTEFDPPKDLKEAESRRDAIAQEVQRIQSQLGDRQRTDRTGRRLAAKEYWAWKSAATHALNEHLNQLRQLRTWIRDHHRAASAQRALVSGDTPAVFHLRAMMLLIQDLEEEDFDHAELAQIDAARDYLRSLSTPRASSDSVK